MKKIAIIGASYLQLPLVEKVNKMGYESYCFAYESGAICKNYCTHFYPISIVEKEHILNVCKELKIDAVLSIASDLAVETVNFIATNLSLTGNSLEATPLMTNKFLMKNALNSQEIKTAKYIAIKSETDISKITEFNFPLIVKPTDRSGSSGVNIVLNKTQLLQALTTAFEASFIKEVIIEEFIDGRELSIESISQGGTHHIVAITDKITSGPPHFVELEHHQPTKEPNIIIEKISHIIPKALDSLKITNGAAHTEIFITSNDEIYINEIGARMGGDFIGSHLVQLSTGFDYLEATINIALGDKVNLIKKFSNYSGVIFSSVINKNEVKKMNFQNVKIIEEKELSEIKNSLTQSNDRHKYIIYQSDKRLTL